MCCTTWTLARKQHTQREVFSKLDSTMCLSGCSSTLYSCQRNGNGCTSIASPACVSQSSQLEDKRRQVGPRAAARLHNSSIFEHTCCGFCPLIDTTGRSAPSTIPQLLMSTSQQDRDAINSMVPTRLSQQSNRPTTHFTPFAA